MASPVPSPASSDPSDTARSPRGRRTQAQRSAQTQHRILDAAAACLVEQGYAATTTVEVAKRAGVSRGAMLHHFPNRQELVTMAVTHVCQKRHAEFRSAMAQLPAQASLDCAVDTTIELLWRYVESPSFVAWLELVVASRTEPELQPAVWSMQEQLRELVTYTFDRMMQRLGRPPSPRLRMVPDLVFSLLDGLRVRGFASRDGLAGESAQVRDALKHWVLQLLSA